MLVEFTSYPVSNFQVRPREWLYSSQTDVGTLNTRRYASGGSAGGGALVGIAVFSLPPVYKELSGSSPPQIEITREDYESLDNFFDNINLDNGDDLVFTEIPLISLGERTLRGLSTTVASQVAENARYTTKLASSQPNLSVGMYVNLGTIPIKCCKVIQKISNTDFIFSPNHKLGPGTRVLEATKILARSRSYIFDQQTALVKSNQDQQAGISWEFQEVTQPVRA